MEEEICNYCFGKKLDAKNHLNNYKERKKQKREKEVETPFSWWGSEVRKDSVGYNAISKFNIHLDHTYYAIDKYGREIVVTEPYDYIEKESIIDLIDFCNENNLEFTIGGDSTWNPGRCYRVTFYRSDKCMPKLEKFYDARTDKIDSKS